MTSKWKPVSHFPLTEALVSKTPLSARKKHVQSAQIVSEELCG